MKIGEFLKRARQQLVTCLPDSSLAALARLMYSHSIGAMPVCEEGNRMIGIVSERDLVRVFARTDWSELKYLRSRDIMTTRVISCGPEDTMRAAQDVMRFFRTQVEGLLDQCCRAATTASRRRFISSSDSCRRRASVSRNESHWLRIRALRQSPRRLPATALLLYQQAAPTWNSRFHRDEADHQGDRRQHFEVDERLESDATDLLHVLHAGDAVHDAAEDDWSDDHHGLHPPILDNRQMTEVICPCLSRKRYFLTGLYDG
jgi:CBS domain